MITQERLRADLHAEAEQVELPLGFADAAIRRGRRVRLVRRAGAGVGVIAAATAAAAMLAVLPGPGPEHVITPGDEPTTSADPWWQTWPTDRSYGPVDDGFVHAARPQYGDAGPESIRVYAAGTTSDGTDFAFFTDERSPHQLQFVQGWAGQPDFSDSVAVPADEWTWDASPTWTTGGPPPPPDGPGGEWLIFVGRPGTTQIEFAGDGVSWEPADLHDGIGVVLYKGAWPPVDARVRLSDDTGAYATDRLFDRSVTSPTPPSP